MFKDIKLFGVSRVSLIDYLFVLVGLMKVKKMERLREFCYCLMRFCWKRIYFLYKLKVFFYFLFNKLKVFFRYLDRNRRF